MFSFFNYLCLIRFLLYYCYRSIAIGISPFFFSEHKKEAHSEEVPIPAFTTTLQKTHIEMCRANIHGHTDSKCFLQSSIYEVVIQEWTFTISLPNFLFSDLCFYFYLKCFSREYEMHSLLLNLSLNGQKCKTEKEKRIYFCQKCRLAKALPQFKYASNA